MARRFIERLRTELDLLYNGGDTFRLALLASPNPAGFPFTVGASTLTATGHNFVTGVRVRVSSGGGALPVPLQLATTYFVRDVAGTDFKLTDTRGGAALTITGGTGIHTITEQQPDNTDSLATLARLEVDYQGAVIRPIYNPEPAIADYVGLRALLPAQTLIFEPTNGSIVWRYSLLIRNGTGTRLDATGQADNIHDHGIDKTIVSGSLGEGISITITRKDL